MKVIISRGIDEKGMRYTNIVINDKVITSPFGMLENDYRELVGVREIRIRYPRCRVKKGSIVYLGEERERMFEWNPYFYFNHLSLLDIRDELYRRRQDILSLYKETFNEIPREREEKERLECELP